MSIKQVIKPFLPIQTVRLCHKKNYNFGDILTYFNVLIDLE